MSWLHRAVLGGLLLTAYLFFWTPVRTAWTHAASALLTHASPTSTVVNARPQGHTVRVQPADGRGRTYQSPAGVKFLLPGLFLVVIRPSRPRLGLFLGGHLVLGLLALGLTLLGTAGVDGGFVGAGVLQTYGVDAYSLSVPVVLFSSSRASGPGQPHLEIFPT